MLAECILAAAGAAAGAAAPAPPGPAVLAVVLHVPAGELAPDAAWLDGQLVEANRLFAPAGVQFAVVGRRALADSLARLESRADRDALAPRAERGVVNAFVVASLRDVDDPALYRRGVHWRWRRDRARHYVIVSTVAGPTVLAHELGHFFGNGHTDVVDNVMSYRRDDPARMAFDEVQRRRIARAARAMVRGKALRTAPPAPAAR